MTATSRPKAAIEPAQLNRFGEMVFGDRVTFLEVGDGALEAHLAAVAVVAELDDAGGLVDPGQARGGVLEGRGVAGDVVVVDVGGAVGAGDLLEAAGAVVGVRGDLGGGVLGLDQAAAVVVAQVALADVGVVGPGQAPQAVVAWPGGGRRGRSRRPLTGPRRRRGCARCG